MSKIKCYECFFLEVSIYNINDKKYSCKKMWFGGCNEPSKYGHNLCNEKKDFQKAIKSN